MTSNVANGFYASSKPVLAFIVFLLIWQCGAPIIGIPSYVLPLPLEIVARFAETWPTQLQALLMTGFTTVTGLVLALLIGVPLALTVIYVPPLRQIIMPALAASNSIPKLAVAPLFV